MITIIVFNHFTVEEESDIGINIFTGEYKNTLFADACKKTLLSGQPAFSDFEFYEPSNNALTGFILDVIRDGDGDKLGLIAFQIEPNQIDKILTHKYSLYNSYDVIGVRHNLNIAGVALAIIIELGIALQTMTRKLRNTSEENDRNNVCT